MPLQHKSPETIYRGQEAYVRIDAQAFQEHGEVKITGEPIIADESRRSTGTASRLPT